MNNFYASCERLFRPDLKGRPIVVLSNNDGCVGRSAEAKALGIKMGYPYFQIRQFFEAMGGVWFSSNYALYGDMSNRVMTILEGWRRRWRSQHRRGLYRAERIMGR